MSTNPFKENMICDLGTIKAQSQLPISMSTPITCESQTAANTKLTRPRRRSRSNVVTGPPKSLCLPRLCGLENIASVLIVRQESPWDTYRKVITYEIAGKVTIATRRTRPFGRLEHTNVLSLHECYMHEDLAFFLVDDLPLTLAHVVAFPSVYPSEAELGSIICQILDGVRCLALSGLAHQSLACDDILLGIDGIIKIACLDLCVDCTPDQSEAAYIAALPLITMRLMQKCDKDEGVVGVNDLERWPIDSAAVGFLSATETAGSIKSLRHQPLLAGKHRPSDDLVVLARAALLSSSLNFVYNPELKSAKGQRYGAQLSDLRKFSSWSYDFTNMQHSTRLLQFSCYILGYFVSSAT
ncbi:hypothetical protein N7471_013785 [Penicillium samsonianum]|uniref:uncharacterized protein n=1 Tax=Penicillium samsonianum TaxID=1882272 RepID=UPI002548BCF9|nr:uncharacterized protein N7471_013785 [Penicillium samsonianum]KAJ6118318.1 hypothetical protein N7471_013785 [Penicillium samsonianum]